MKNLFYAFLFFFCIQSVQAKDGYDLWLDYSSIKIPTIRSEAESLFSGIYFFGKNPTYNAIQFEMEKAIPKMIGKSPIYATDRINAAKMWLGTREELAQVIGLDQQMEIKNLGDEGYWMGPIELQGKTYFSIIGNKPIGVLYGVFRLLQEIQREQVDFKEELSDSPKVKIRMLNHWDNLDRTVERGYAGFSIWDWHKLPGYVDPRYIDYARANASLGINAVSLTNVNANAWILRPDFIEKVKVLADIFRPYGIKVYLTARFSAPIELGGLETADPLNPDVAAFWKEKVGMIYEAIPDFGGFVVKANSEGQPGPH
ncbi:MAG TPA: alpha-glucuronidase, partial [Algoriphagus sp.]|nr:alpha-glucuronidase [Algoriphagus sp.]